MRPRRGAVDLTASDCYGKDRNDGKLGENMRYPIGVQTFEKIIENGMVYSKPRTPAGAVSFPIQPRDGHTRFLSRTDKNLSINCLFTALKRKLISVITEM